MIDGHTGQNGNGLILHADLVPEKTPGVWGIRAPGLRGPRTFLTQIADAASWNWSLIDLRSWLPSCSWTSRCFRTSQKEPNGGLYTVNINVPKRGGRVMSQPGIRLWMAMVAIAIIAVLLAQGSARRIDDGTNDIELIEVSGSERAVGLTETWRVWIKVGDSFPNRMVSSVIPPTEMVLKNRGKVTTESYYFIRVEYLAALVFISATMLAPVVVYLHGRRREASLRRSPTSLPGAEHRLTPPPEPNRSGEAERV
jgi:hypothetical protein